MSDFKKGSKRLWRVTFADGTSLLTYGDTELEARAAARRWRASREPLGGSIPRGHEIASVEHRPKMPKERH